MSETARWTGPAPPQQQRAQQVNGRADGANLADILERVLDKGIVIAGDIQVNLLDIELLTIKIRLVVASVDRAKEMGIDWWERDPTLSAGRRDLEDENRELRARITALEQGGRRDADDQELPSETEDEQPQDEAADEPHDEEPPDDVDDSDTDDPDVEDAEMDAPDVDDPDREDDHSEEPEEPDRHDGSDADERPAKGASGRSGRARSRRGEPGPDDDPDPPEPGRGRNGRGRGRASRDGDEREMPVRRKAGSKRASTSRER